MNHDEKEKKSKEKKDKKEKKEKKDKTDKKDKKEKKDKSHKDKKHKKDAKESEVASATPQSTGTPTPATEDLVASATAAAPARPTEKPTPAATEVPAQPTPSAALPAQPAEKPTPAAAAHAASEATPALPAQPVHENVELLAEDTPKRLSEPIPASRPLPADMKTSINVEVKAERDDGEVVCQTFVMRPTTPFSKLFDSWCKYQSIPRTGVVFERDGRELCPDDTITSLNIPVAEQSPVIVWAYAANDEDEEEQEGYVLASIPYKHDWQSEYFNHIASLKGEEFVVKVGRAIVKCRPDGTLPKEPSDESDFPLKILRLQVDETDNVEEDAKGDSGQGKDYKSVAEAALNRATTNDLQQQQHPETPGAAVQEEQKPTDEQINQRKKEITRFWRSMKSRGLESYFKTIELHRDWIKVHTAVVL